MNEWENDDEEDDADCWSQWLMLACSGSLTKIILVTKVKKSKQKSENERVTVGVSLTSAQNAARQIFRRGDIWRRTDVVPRKATAVAD